MTISPELTFRQRRRDAALVSDLLDKAMVMETLERRQDFEKAAAWFSEKHHCQWVKWIDKEQQQGRA